jgi:hypothetical protein
MDGWILYHIPLKLPQSIGLDSHFSGWKFSPRFDGILAGTTVRKAGNRTGEPWDPLRSGPQYIYNHCICTHIYTHIYMYVYIYIYVYMCVYIYIFINYLIYDSYICTYICLTYKIYIHRLRSWIVPVLFFWGDAAHQRTYAGRGQGRVAMGIPNFWPIAMSQKSVDSPFTVP